MTKKLFSIGSKRENAKVINVEVTKKRIILFGLFVVACVVAANLMYDPNNYVLCSDGEKVQIQDNMVNLCGVLLPRLNMTEEEIVLWVRTDYFTNNQIYSQEWRFE